MGDELRFIRIFAILLRTYKLVPPLPNYLTTAIQSKQDDYERTYNLLFTKPKTLLNSLNLELKTRDEKVLSTA